MPELNGVLEPLRASERHVTDRMPHLLGGMRNAVMTKILDDDDDDAAAAYAVTAAGADGGGSTVFRPGVDLTGGNDPR